eukprot:CAMPEP_0118926200 /NCGR_PEP_ID=MMETSP1169-20130426/3952_1 /TAXON_ID=36882 /ORGANISM="Pyramimonas obovata, Strain CCMP722" /LENGTH=412 /DNA_ID=CAMNT_0006867703 /DNA_START=2315 /DNA_END=3553 /DNA_ORIENTATION=-
MNLKIVTLLVAAFAIAPVNGGQTCKAGGILDRLSTVCCAAECAVCGGRGCGGGAGVANCCSTVVRRNNRPCSKFDPPCVIDKPVGRPRRPQSDSNLATIDPNFRNEFAQPTLGPKSCFVGLSKVFPSMTYLTRTRPPFVMAGMDYHVDNMISKFVFQHGMWDVHVLKAIYEALGPRGCGQGRHRVVDVGMNLGFFSMAALSLGCRVTSFEMQDRMAEFGRLSACLNDWSGRHTLVHGAVTDEDLSTLSYVVPAGGNIGGVSVDKQAAKAANGAVVRTTRVDREVGSDDKVLVMKVDVEGYEPQAVRSAERLFANGQVRAIVLEFSPNKAELRKFGAMLEYLHGHGFHEMYEIDFMHPKEFSQPLKKRRLDTSEPQWAHKFASHIVNGGDSRREGFTDLFMYHKNAHDDELWQ